MELAPAPVNLSEGVLVLQSPPSLPPGAEDEQEPEGLALVEVEDLHAPASSAAAQAIAPKRSLNCNLWALCVNCCSSRRGWALTGPSGPRRHGGNRRPGAAVRSLPRDLHH